VVAWGHHCAHTWHRLAADGDRAISKVVVVLRQTVQPIDMRLKDAMRFIVTAGAKTGESQSPQERPDSAESVGTTAKD
jgi:hypothetical protein